MCFKVTHLDVAVYLPSTSRFGRNFRSLRPHAERHVAAPVTAQENHSLQVHTSRFLRRRSRCTRSPSGSPWSRAICHYVCHPECWNRGARSVLRGGDLPRARQRDERSFIIYRFDRWKRVMSGAHLERFTEPREKRGRREFRKVSLLLTQARLRTPALRRISLRSNRYTRSLFPRARSRLIVERPNNVTFRSSRLSDSIGNLERCRPDKIIEMISRWTLIASAQCYFQMYW